METANRIQENIEKLEDRLLQLNNCSTFLVYEEALTNDPKVMGAWKVIMKNNIVQMDYILQQLEVDIVNSMLSDRKAQIATIEKECVRIFDIYSGYEDEVGKKSINHLKTMLSKGRNGFRQELLHRPYLMQLFEKCYLHVKASDGNKLKRVYDTDFQNYREGNDDETLRTDLVRKRREEMERTKYGKIYHDESEDKAALVSYVLEQSEINGADVYEFMKCFVALEIAIEAKNPPKKSVIENVCFTDNVDVDKVIAQLQVYVKNKTLCKQKHWYIVYKVLCEKGWLKSKIQTSFIEQINASFEANLKCTAHDFRKVDSYFKEHDSANWDAHCNIAPQCCQQYKNIAMMLTNDFQDKVFAKSGLLIKTPHAIQSFR